MVMTQFDLRERKPTMSSSCRRPHSGRRGRRGRFFWAILTVAAGVLATSAPGFADADGGLDREQLRCIALNIYWEARSGSRESQRAIAHVTRNRAAHADFPDSPCEVVREGGESPPGSCQFSWWCDGKSDEPENAEAWREALAVARQVAIAGDADPTGGALFFHHHSVSPGWASARDRTVRIGDHIYYK